MRDGRIIFLYASPSDWWARNPTENRAICLGSNIQTDTHDKWIDK